MQIVKRGVGLRIIQDSPPPSLGRGKIPSSNSINVAMCEKYEEIYGKYLKNMSKYVEYMKKYGEDMWKYVGKMHKCAHQREAPNKAKCEAS